LELRFEPSVHEADLPAYGVAGLHRLSHQRRPSRACTASSGVSAGTGPRDSSLSGSDLAQLVVSAAAEERAVCMTHRSIDRESNPRKLSSRWFR
jgi:hypothetical protein